MAGTCDEEIPATILATAFRSFAASLRLRFRRRLALGRARLAAVAFDRAPAAEHHGRVVLLRGAGHLSGKMLERVAVGRAELGSEVDIAAKLEHPVVVALEDGFALRWREREPVEVFLLVFLERLA